MQKYNSSEVEILASKILHHKTVYYRGTPEISDSEYDALEDRLKALAPEHPVLSNVGTDEVSGTVKVKHSKPMLSLEKTYELSTLLSWAKKYPVVGTLKIDGNSLSLIYTNGHLNLAKTRGNGREGEDVTAKIKWVSDCVPLLHHNQNAIDMLGQNKEIEIRGELYCSEPQFIRLSNEMVGLGLDKPTNPRNTVAGILGRKQHISLAHFFNFAAFDILDTNGNNLFSTEVEKFHWLHLMGFKLPEFKLLKSGTEITKFLEFSKAYMADADIGIDGVVFTYNDISLHEKLGETSHHPRYKLSFKWQGETATANIVGITWATSRLGVVTPVAVIDPIYLSGASITNVTLHNAAHVKLFDIKVGDKIEIVRSGEVIPKFLRVIKAGSGLCQLPELCPSCQSPLEFDEVKLYCRNQVNCPAQQVGTILNWIRCAGIDDLSEKRLNALMQINLIKHMSDLYKLRKEDFLRLPLTKEKMANKLYDNIQKSKNLPLARFLNGLGIQGAGLTTWESLLERYPTLDELLSAQASDIANIDGFAEKTSAQIVNGLKLKEQDIKMLIASGVTPQAISKSAINKKSPLTGKTLVITGTMSKPRADLEAAIKSVGGKISSSVSKNTYALIIDDLNSNSTKAKKARQLEIPMWDEETLIKHLST
ncbi:MAG: NAD-dependent DNA ligase LigA [Bdellovibrionota bacterium]